MEGWRAEAACRETWVGDWYPQPMKGWRVAALRALCNECPVWGECVQAVLAEEAEFRYGFRGGFTPEERAELAMSNGAPRGQQLARLTRRRTATTPGLEASQDPASAVSGAA